MAQEMTLTRKLLLGPRAERILRSKREERGKCNWKIGETIKVFRKLEETPLFFKIIFLLFRIAIKSVKIGK